MPRNVYFSQAVRSEQNLYEDLVIESLKIFGQDVYYIPRSLVNRDNILNEDPTSNFDDAYLTEAYIENVDGFEGAGDLYQKFGLEIRDEASFVISRKTWNHQIGSYEGIDKPREGDLLFLPMTNSFFEITFVEDDKPFYQLSNLPVYKLTCALFEYNDEDFDTGIDVIDDEIGGEAYLAGIQLAVTNGNHFVRGETVTQTLVAATDTTPAVQIYGTVQTLDKTSNTLAKIGVSNIGVTGASDYRQFIASTTNGLVGSESANTCYITRVYDVGDDDTDNFMPNDSAAQNVAFETFTDNFLDFTETNPFGDPSENF
jgi:hypothetical protein